MTKTQPNTTTAPTGQIAPFGLRMLPELRSRIEEAARTSGRSMNAEIVARLTESLDKPASQGLDVYALISEINKGVSQKVAKAGYTIELKIYHTDAVTKDIYQELMQHKPLSKSEEK